LVPPDKLEFPSRVNLVPTLCCFAQTTKAHQGDDDAIVPSRSGTVQVIRECQMRAVILTELAKDDPVFEDQLLYVAREWLTLATLV
jgi:hypothetical protein